MHKIVNPQQIRLFDSFSSILTEKTRTHLEDGWQGVFRHVILELMPVEQISRHFNPTLGRPTKEMYSMAGLLLIKEFMNWTKPEALDAYRFNIGIQYALNLEPVAQDLSLRTLERQIALFAEEGLAKTVMEHVTARLVEALDLKIDKQRLDSTHIFSDMASFGRTRLMGVAIKRFLTQVKRHDTTAYETLDESLRQRYAPGVNQLFAGVAKDTDSRRLLRQQVAEDMHALVRLFADNASHNGKDTYKALERIFYEQCEVHEETVSVKKKTGGAVMQNPSDPEATYDGHKGPGYQVQLSETCHPDNAVQLITCAIPQTAAEPDGHAVEAVLEDLAANALMPDDLLVDTAYAGDDNVALADEKGVELVGPVPSGSRQTQDDADERLNIDDFDVDDTTEEVVCCPAGHTPTTSVHDQQTEKTTTVMPESACSGCEFFEQCPVEKHNGQYRLEHTAKQRRLAARRREQETEVFKERYKIRGGIEGTNSGLKRKTGLGQLRVRGGPAVFHAILLKVAGWNILRAAACAKMQKIVYERACRAVLGRIFAILRPRMTTQHVRIGLKTHITAYVRRYGELPLISIAA
jgi:hypothetical protein